MVTIRFYFLPLLPHPSLQSNVTCQVLFRMWIARPQAQQDSCSGRIEQIKEMDQLDQVPLIISLTFFVHSHLNLHSYLLISSHWYWSIFCFSFQFQINGQKNSVACISQTYSMLISYNVTHTKLGFQTYFTDLGYGVEFLRPFSGFLCDVAASSCWTRSELTFTVLS